MDLLLDTHALLWWVSDDPRLGPVAAQLSGHGFTELPLTVRHGLAMAALPFHHADPFDRMLIARSRIEGVALVTSDRAIGAYDVPLLAAHH